MIRNGNTQNPLILKLRIKLDVTVRRFNQQLKQATNDYGSRVRQYNNRLKHNQQTIKLELTKIQSHNNSIKYSVLRSSTLSLSDAYSQLERDENVLMNYKSGTWFMNSSEREITNSLKVSNALEELDDLEILAKSDQNSLELSNSRIHEKISSFSLDLGDRWKGALYALSPNNPDASRHFCTSTRELFIKILNTKAPDRLILSDNPNCEKTKDGKPTRREKIRFIMIKAGISISSAVEFYDSNINNIMQLFSDFNEGTHGQSGVFQLPQLLAIKTRVEDSLEFLLEFQ